MNDINNQYQRVAGNKTNNAQAKASPTQGADQAKFTPESQTLLRITQTSKDVSDINQKKVDRIKQALEDGEFPIDVARVAEKMTSLEKLIQG